MPKSITPKPVVVKTICSMCDLDWEDHGDNPTTEDCIRLLKAEVAKKSSGCTHYHYPWYWQYQQIYPSVITSGTTWQSNYNTNNLSNTLDDGHAYTVNYATPAISSATLSSTSA